MRKSRTTRAFSLLEVVAAVGIFTMGIVVVVALLGPVTRSVANMSDADAAAAVADAVRARLEAMPFQNAIGLLQTAEEAANGGTMENNPRAMYASRSNELGVYDRAAQTWVVVDYSGAVPVARAMPIADRFFVVELVRDETISPAGADALAAAVAFTIRASWPAAAPIDRRQSMLLAGCLRR